MWGFRVKGNLISFCWVVFSVVFKGYLRPSKSTMASPNKESDVSTTRLENKTLPKLLNLLCSEFSITT